MLANPRCRILIVAITVIFVTGGISIAQAADALTQADYSTLASIGYAQGTPAWGCVTQLTDQQRGHLHFLLIDPATSGDQKKANVHSYCEQVALDNIWNLATQDPSNANPK